MSTVCGDSRIVNELSAYALVRTEQGTEARYLLALSWASF